MHEVKRRRALPVYIAALVFALYALIAPLYTLWHFLLAALVTAGTWLAADALIPPVIEYEAEPQPSYGEAADAVLARAKAFAEMAARCAPAMGSDGEALVALAALSDKIAQTVTDSSADPARIRRFQDYYLSTTEKLAEAYVRLEDTGAEGENTTGSHRRIAAMLEAEKEAFVRFLDGLFGAQAIDIESEIEVMRMRMRAEGLTDDGMDDAMKQNAE